MAKLTDQLERKFNKLKSDPKLRKLRRDPKLFARDALLKRAGLLNETLIRVDANSTPLANKEHSASTGQDKVETNDSTKRNQAKLTAQNATITQYNQQCYEFIKRYDVNSIKVGKEYIWPYLRAHISVNLYATWRGREKYKQLQPRAIFGGHYSDFTPRLRDECKARFEAREHDSLNDLKADVLLFTQHSGFGRIEVDDHIYHRLLDPLYEAALEVGTARKVELLVNPNMKFIELWNKYKYKTLQILPPNFEKVGYHKRLAYRADFFTNYKSIFRTQIPANLPLLNSLVDHEMFTREWLLEVLKQLQPKVIFLCCYHYHAALISAAHELGILTVDVQHGLQAGDGILYNHHYEVPEEGYQAYPDYFAVWGKKEFDNIEKNYPNRHQPLYLGNPWLEKLKDFPESLSTPLKRKLRSKKHLKGLIILKDQQEVNDLYKKAISQNPNVLWMVRHHPTARKIFTNSDFSIEGKIPRNLVIDREIDGLLFPELFKYVNFTLSEGSALAVEASYYGVDNIVFTDYGYDNFKSEIDAGNVHYVKDSVELNDIVDTVNANEIREDQIGAFQRVDLSKLIKGLIRQSNKKKPAGTPFIFNNEYDIQLFAKQIDDIKVEMEQVASTNPEAGSHVYYKLREKLSDAPSVKSLYEAEQEYFKKESRIFQSRIHSLFDVAEHNVVMVSDSLGLPRPHETVMSHMCAHKTTTWFFNRINKLQFNELHMKTWAQRYLTTDKLLLDWNNIVGDLKNRHLVIHLGLNDSSERIFSEQQRLGMDVLEHKTKTEIVQFGKDFRKHIIGNQFEFCYVSHNKFVENLKEIICRSRGEGALSVTFVTIMPFPQSHEVNTPRSRANTAKFNDAIAHAAHENPIFVKVIDIDKLFQRNNKSKCMLSDDMHLSHYGHEVLAQEIHANLSEPKNMSSTYRIAIIGVGQLGSRHLQGLKTINLDVQVELLEKSLKAQTLASERFNEMPENEHIKSVRFCQEVDELSDELDLVIIATNADVRANVLKKLMSTKKVNNLILEKVLFQQLSDYSYFQYEFAKHDMNVWVNHPRRLFTAYERFIDDLRASKSMRYHVQGTNWGMACNGLHFLDHALYLQGDTLPSDLAEVRINSSAVKSSKRSGCYEVFGSLAGKIGKADVVLSCDESAEGVVSNMITITTEDLRLIIDEVSGVMNYAYRQDDWKWHQIEERLTSYQSELTGIVVSEILQTGRCNLPSYTEASYLHKPFIIAMKSAIEMGTGQSFKVCPIS